MVVSEGGLGRVMGQEEGWGGGGGGGGMENEGRK